MSAEGAYVYYSTPQFARLARADRLLHGIHDLVAGMILCRLNCIQVACDSRWMCMHYLLKKRINPTPSQIPCGVLSG